jgi:integrase
MFYNHTSKISNLPLASLTAKMVTEQSLNPMIEAGHTSQARLLLVCLKRLSNFAYEHDITEHNQLAKLRNDFYKVIPRAIVLSNQELISFMKALNDEAISEAKRAFLYLTLLLGTRKMELVNLTWHNYDQSAKTIKLVETKNKTDLLISLPSQALAILDKMPRINEFVFPSGKNIRMDKPIGKSTPNAWLREVVEIAKIGENLTVHDLRRTFVTTLAELGFPFELIDTAVNHKLSGVRAHYFTSKDLERRRDMLQKWANHLDALLGCQ